MNANEIYSKLVERFGEHDIPLMHAMLQEASEHADNSDIADDEKINAAFIAFYVSVKSMMAVLSAAFQNSDVVVINYRNQSFELDPQSLFVKVFSQL